MTAALPTIEARLKEVPALPRMACIELTSRCPLDCVFCTRKRTRGHGQDMDWALFESIVRQLGRPERVCLNCCGESVHYPRLGDAIRLVKRTGAAAELISTIATASETVLRELLEAGLDNLHVSLHTLDSALYAALYRHGLLATARRNIERFLALRQSVGAATVLDFAFLALDRNLASLAEVVAYADGIGVRHITILALMQPSDTRHLYPDEIEGNYLTLAFRRRLRETVERVRGQYPAVYLHAPNLDDDWRLDGEPRSYPGPLPAGAYIATCLESPWRVITVQANGDVPACGEDGMEIVGNLARTSLHEIWNGERFNTFRAQHARGEHPVCRICPGKDAYWPAPP